MYVAQRPWRPGRRAVDGNSFGRVAAHRAGLSDRHRVDIGVDRLQNEYCEYAASAIYIIHVFYMNEI